MYDVITLGSATQDVFLRGKHLKEKEEKKVVTEKGIVLKLGSKIPVDEVRFSSGGGGTNSAFTFQKQGFKVAYIGKVGLDGAGKNIKEEIKDNKISTEFICSDKKLRTNYSVIISTENDRTILVYKGASGNLEKKEIPWKRVKTKWFYIAPLYGKTISIWEEVLKYAKKNNIKVAVNPSKDQLSLPKKKLEKLLGLSDVLILNQEEASLATGILANKEDQILKAMNSLVGGIVIITKGMLGVVVSDGKFSYKAKTILGRSKKIIDRTGAGDSFGSGFVTGMMKAKSELSKNDILKYALQFGSANASACIQSIGAKNGLLKKNESIFKWGTLKIKEEKV